jgi:hypothetical protein
VELKSPPSAAVDAAEDELYGDARGDELPEHLRTSEGRRAALKEAKGKLEAERAKANTKTDRTDDAASGGVRGVARGWNRAR